MPTSIQTRARSALRLSLCCLFTALLPGAAEAQQRWLTLPPTPTLPEHTSSGHVDRKDALLWYASYGDETKPVVLLLHGGGGSSDYWGHLIRDLMRDHRVIVFDCRGQGRSTNDAAAISYEQMARDAIAVLDQLGVKQASVIGWSDGANIGFYLALRHAERVSALIAFAGNATPAGYQSNTNPSTMQAYVAATSAEYQRLSPHAKKRGEVSRLLSVMWKTQPTLTVKELTEIRVRTAIFHGEYDEVIRRSHSQELAAQIPNAKYVLLRGVSHFALLQDPQGFEGAVRHFLNAR